VARAGNRAMVVALPKVGGAGG